MNIRVSGQVGQKLRLEVIDSLGRVASAETSSLLSSAAMRPLTQKDVDKAVGKLGDTPYRLVNSIDVSNLADDSFIPSAEIKVARRVALDKLSLLRRNHNRAEDLNAGDESLFSSDVNLEELDDYWQFIDREDTTDVKLSVLCRNPRQVIAACKVTWLEEICLDFLEVICIT